MKGKYNLNDLKNNFVKYNFKKLGDIDISDWVQKFHKKK